MKHSLKHGAGYLSIDHRDSPGLTAADVAAVPGALVAPGGDVLERDVAMCSHCQRAVLLEPLRVRARGFCPKCNAYVCDGCETIRAKTGDCTPAVKVFDRAQEHAAQFLNQPDHPDAGPALILTDG